MTTEISATPPENGSAFARLALLGYALLIIYASWYPFTGWQNNGLPPFGFLSSPLPHYWTVFDITTNVIAYVPFGMLLVFAVYPQLRGAPALLLVLVAALLWSGTMESVQLFLPTRVASNLDLLTNVGGAVNAARAAVAVGWNCSAAVFFCSRAACCKCVNAGFRMKPVAGCWSSVPGRWRKFTRKVICLVRAS